MMATPPPLGPAPQLITLDIGYTLGAPGGSSLTVVLAEDLPLPEAEARRIVQCHLHTLDVLDDETISRVSQDLHIPAGAFPRDHRLPRFDFWPGAIEAVAELARLLPVATLSNITRADDAASAVAQTLRPYLSGHHPSYLLGYAKPDPRALRAVAAAHGVSPEQIIHLGDSVECDVRTALQAGARAVWINEWITDHPLALPAELADDAGRLHVAPTLTAAVAYVRGLLNPSTPPSPTLDNKGVVL
ncbi:HAD family hydrolase [Nonomuraea sp. NPDC026600]|uniref:HAD family hydrolase n=1 Tax=Nonomuraea sp. NPDC026600 TaxID=3155363 RepID=UPI0033DA8B53